MLSDVKSKELLTLLRRERASEKPFSTQEQITARRTAEHTIGPDENMYRVTWVCDFLNFFTCWGLDFSSCACDCSFMTSMLCRFSC